MLLPGDKVPLFRERLEFVDGVSPEDRVFRDREAKNVGNAVEESVPPSTFITIDACSVSPVVSFHPPKMRPS